MTATHENCLSLATVVLATVAGHDLEVHVLATSVQELKDTVSALTPVNEAPAQDAPVNEAPAQDAPVQEEAVPTATPTASSPAPETPAATQSAPPAPSVAATAPATDATSSATATTAPSNPAPAIAPAEVKPEQLQNAAIALLEGGGEEKLVEILGKVGAQTVGTIPAEKRAEALALMQS